MFIFIDSSIIAELEHRRLERDLDDPCLQNKTSLDGMFEPKYPFSNLHTLFWYLSMLNREMIMYCLRCHADVITERAVESIFIKFEMRNWSIPKLGLNPFMRSIGRRSDSKLLKLRFNFLCFQSTSFVLRDQISTDPWRPLKRKFILETDHDLEFSQVNRQHSRINNGFWIVAAP